jgi:WXXGXW repeat (2 copies)
MNSSMMKYLVRSLLFAMALLCISGASKAQVAVGISVGFAPPALPVYEQPICPEDGWIWTPGYWAWDGDDYYWVPGTWVAAPEAGFLWTPPYWGWANNAFFFHEGFWGPHVGWYGGINYGFGYFGTGFVGGRWDGGHFFYNREVANVNVNIIHNVYNTRVENITVNHISYNGGQGGIDRRPTAEEQSYDRERHVGPVAAQQQHIQEARGNRDLRASVNQGRPSIAATDRPGSFKGNGVVQAREAGGHYEPPANRGAAARPGTPENGARPGTPEAAAKPAVHPNDMPAYERQPAPNTGNAKTDAKYQQQQQKLYDQQNKERQKLQSQQDKEHTKAEQSKANDASKAQMEQRHAQQTQAMQQRHTQQTQQMQQRQAPASHPSGGGERH